MLACTTFTYHGKLQAEHYVQSLLEHVSKIVKQHIPSQALTALVLLGGYGRGEGGTIQVNNTYLPHNNLDLLVILRRDNRLAHWSERLNNALSVLRGNSSIGIDLSVISDKQLRKSGCRVMWYDMRLGHKTLLGDVDFVPSLTHCKLSAIPDWDIRDLLVNRGSLLVINQILLPLAKQRTIAKTVIKHMMKAIIGYGDALLFFLGDYHWSYAQKRQNMAERKDVDEAFRRLYDEAMAFRFSPDYERYLCLDLAAWSRQLRKILACVHLRCERLRLNSEELTWETYLDQAIYHSLRRDCRSARQLARRVRDRLTQRHSSEQRSALGGFPGSLMAVRDYLPLLLPAVIYSDFSTTCCESSYRQRSRLLLNSTSNTPLAIAKAYLRAWRQHLDPNLSYVLEKLAVSIEEDVL